jgi:hypothetical protein
MSPLSIIIRSATDQHPGDRPEAGFPTGYPAIRKQFITNVSGLSNRFVSGESTVGEMRNENITEIIPDINGQA